MSPKPAAVEAAAGERVRAPPRRPAERPEEPVAAIEGGALVGIAEEVVGLADLLEARLGLRVAGVAVWVVLAGELAVGLLDLRGGRLAIDAEDAVRDLWLWPSVAASAGDHHPGGPHHRADRSW